MVVDVVVTAGWVWYVFGRYCHIQVVVIVVIAVCTVINIIRISNITTCSRWKPGSKQEG